MIFLGKQPGSISGVKLIPQGRVGEEGSHPKLTKGWRPAAAGVPSAGLSLTERGVISPLAPMPGSPAGSQDNAPWRPRHTLTVLGAKNGSVGTDGQSQRGGKGSAWVRKLPVPGASWALRETQRTQWAWWERGQTEGRRQKCTLGENTQNLRHQTDEEVAIWGRRSTERGPRRSVKRHTTELTNMPGSQQPLSKHLLPREAR